MHEYAPLRGPPHNLIPYIYVTKCISVESGEPPIVIMTHKDSGAKSHELENFKTGLRHDLKIEYVFDIENYTKDDHDYDERKHVDLLEALHQCTIVADKMMKHAEGQGGCTIL